MEDEAKKRICSFYPHFQASIQATFCPGTSFETVHRWGGGGGGKEREELLVCKGDYD